MVVDAGYGTSAASGSFFKLVTPAPTALIAVLADGAEIPSGWGWNRNDATRRIVHVPTNNPAELREIAEVEARVFAYEHALDYVFETDNSTVLLRPIYINRHAEQIDECGDCFLSFDRGGVPLLRHVGVRFEEMLVPENQSMWVHRVSW